MEHLLGKQEFRVDEGYRFSSFCLTMPVKDGVLFFNNLTKELLLLTQEEAKAANPETENDIFRALVEKRFYVPDEFNEVEVCEQIRSLLRLTVTDVPITRFTILPTTACNARCFYCFEAGVTPVTMTEKTAEDVARFIQKKSAGKEVHLTWFGGEPLCNIKAIDIICGYLKGNDVSFQSMIVTNGYLFDEQTAKRAVTEWNLLGAQITLDGTEKKYNQIKNYKNNDANAFKRVLDNVESLCEKNVRINLRMNMGCHNIDDLRDLIDLLGERFSKYKNFFPRINVIYEDVGYKKTTYSEEQKQLIFEKRKELFDQIASKGFPGVEGNYRRFKITSCQADGKDSTMILPDGRLGFCEHYVGEDTYGSIYDDPGKPFWSPYKTPEEKCKTCAAYPSCLLLAKCPAAMHGCQVYNQHFQIQTLYAGMKTAYEAYMKAPARQQDDVSVQ